MSNQMNPGGNPTTTNTPSTNRYGKEGPRSLRAYRAGELHQAAMSAPNAKLKCVHVSRAERAEFVVRAPNGVTAFTIHYGRWVEGLNRDGATGADLDGWLETGTRAVTGATVGELFAVEVDTHGDAVGVYVDTFTGTATGDGAANRFQFWFRSL